MLIISKHNFAITKDAISIRNHNKINKKLRILLHYVVNDCHNGQTKITYKILKLFEDKKSKRYKRFRFLYKGRDRHVRPTVWKFDLGHLYTYTTKDAMGRAANAGSASFVIEWMHMVPCPVTCTLRLSFDSVSISGYQ